MSSLKSALQTLHSDENYCVLSTENFFGDGSGGGYCNFGFAKLASRLHSKYSHAQKFFAHLREAASKADAWRAEMLADNAMAAFLMDGALQLSAFLAAGVDDAAVFEALVSKWPELVAGCENAKNTDRARVWVSTWDLAIVMDETKWPTCRPIAMAIRDQQLQYPQRLEGVMAAQRLKCAENAGIDEQPSVGTSNAWVGRRLECLEVHEIARYHRWDAGPNPGLLSRIDAWRASADWAASRRAYESQWLPRHRWGSISKPWSEWAPEEKPEEGFRTRRRRDDVELDSMFGCEVINCETWSDLVDDVQGALKVLCFCDYDRSRWCMETYGWEALLRIEAVQSLVAEREAFMAAAAAEVKRRAPLVITHHARQGAARKAADEWEAAHKASDVAAMDALATTYKGLDEPVVLSKSFGLGSAGPSIALWDPRDQVRLPASLAPQAAAFREEATKVYHAVAECGVTEAAAEAAKVLETLAKDDGAWCADNSYLRQKQWRSGLSSRLEVPDTAIKGYVDRMFAACKFEDEKD